MTKILLVGQTPPPFHGQAIATENLFKHDWDGESICVSRLRMAYSDTTAEVGRFAMGKVFHLFGLAGRSIAYLLCNRGALLYYPPSGPRAVPVVRDILYLAAVRPFARGSVFHFHAGGLTSYLDKHRLLRVFARLVYRRPLASIEISDEDPSPADYFDARRRFLVPNGLDVPRVPRERPGGERFRLLYVGSLRRTKGILDMVETARLLAEKEVEFEMSLVGGWRDEATRHEVEARISEANLQHRIRFAGLLTGDDKWQAYADADAFFFPSHYDAENFPLVLIEAMAYGLPVVTTDWRGIPSLVGGKEQAFLLPVKSPAAYAGAIAEMIENCELTTTMSRAAEARYRERFTLGHFIAEIDKVFRWAGETAER